MHKTAKVSSAVKFVLIIGVLSFFADFTYEGSRSILGPYLALLQASGTAVAVVSGFGELLGYGLRLISGPLADRTGKFWPITIFGYILQMASVPLLAFAANWQVAAALIILERVGKAIRNPPRDVMLSHAAKQIGYGKAFGVHEALDQFGALFGPLAVAATLAIRGDYRFAFAALLLPGTICLSLLLAARWLYPRPEEMEIMGQLIKTRGFPRAFWIYLTGVALVAAAFADFPLIAFHFQRTGSISGNWIPIAYAIAMAVSGTGSLVFGHLFDRFGISMLVPLTVLSALFAPLVFFGGFWATLLGRYSVMGTWDGRARINYPGGGGTNDPSARTCLCLRNFYSRLWYLLVYWERIDRDLVRPIDICRDCVLHPGGVVRNSILSGGPQNRHGCMNDSTNASSSRKSRSVRPSCRESDPQLVVITTACATVSTRKRKSDSVRCSIAIRQTRINSSDRDPPSLSPVSEIR